jgi:hypothetical protein
VTPTQREAVVELAKETSDEDKDGRPLCVTDLKEQPVLVARAVYARRRARANEE